MTERPARADKTTDSTADLSSFSEPKTEPKPSAKAEDAGFHDSMTGRAVDKDGNFLDGSDGPVPKDRIVANNWPGLQKEADEEAGRNE